jgi:hypothetical protein
MTRSTTTTPVCGRLAAPDRMQFSAPAMERSI